MLPSWLNFAVYAKRWVILFTGTALLLRRYFVSRWSLMMFSTDGASSWCEGGSLWILWRLTQVHCNDVKVYSLSLWIQLFMVVSKPVMEAAFWYFIVTQTGTERFACVRFVANFIFTMKLVALERCTVNKTSSFPGSMLCIANLAPNTLGIRLWNMRTITVCEPFRMVSPGVTARVSRAATTRPLFAWGPGVKSSKPWKPWKP